LFRSNIITDIARAKLLVYPRLIFVGAKFLHKSYFPQTVSDKLIEALRQFGLLSPLLSEKDCFLVKVLVFRCRLGPWFCIHHRSVRPLGGSANQELPDLSKELTAIKVFH